MQGIAWRLIGDGSNLKVPNGTGDLYVFLPCELHVENSAP